MNNGSRKSPKTESHIVFQVIDEYVYGLLETEVNLKPHTIPTDAGEQDARSSIYMSADAMDNPDKLMVLVHGSGVVRAGQWARRSVLKYLP